MMDLTRRRELSEWLNGCLVASVLVAPDEPGLTYDEILELGGRRGFGSGEVRDLLQQQELGGTRILPQLGIATHYLIDFNDVYVNDPRSLEAFVYVCDQFIEAARQHGSTQASIPIDVLVERGVSFGLERGALRAACAAYWVTRQAEVKNGVMSWKAGYAHPRQQSRTRVEHFHPAASVLQEVRDVTARRTDGRALAVDPLDAFAERLSTLAHEDKRIWWHHVVGELQTLNPQTHPTSVLVLAAALAEGALTLLVKAAQEATGGAAFAGRSFNDPANASNWRFQDLLKAARHESAGMIDQKLYDAGMALNDDRRRIHLGRFLPGAASPARLDIRPHEAEAAVAVTKRLITALLEWLAAHETKPS